MEFFSFHLTPWPHLPAGYVGPAGVRCPNELCVPVRGHDVYNRFLDELAYGEQLGFDGRVVNEHHRFLGRPSLRSSSPAPCALYFFDATGATNADRLEPVLPGPQPGGAYAAAIPGGGLEVLEGCGHLPALDHPAEAAAAIAVFANKEATSG